MESVFKSVDERSARMRSDSVKNMSAYADQNHAPSLAAARLELPAIYLITLTLSTPSISVICCTDSSVITESTSKIA